MYNQNFVAFDVETTGLSVVDNEIIEIGLVKFENGKLVKEYSQFLRPHQRISEYVINMTGITNDMVSTAPRFEEVVDEITDFIGDSFLVGHNISFDLGMLNSALERCQKAPVNNQHIDTLDLIALLLPTERSYKLGHLAKHFDIAEENVHRAKDDALMTSNLYLKLLEMIKDLDPEIVKFLYYYVAAVGWSFKEVLETLFPDCVSQEEFSWLLLFNKKMLEEEVALPVENKKRDIHDIFSAFKKDGLFSDKLKNYEVRTSQLEMLERVWESFEASKHVVIEAGTGIGKSFAYAVPALFYSLNTAAPVIISTKTKNLQEQLYDKDIPFIQKALDIEFRCIMVKGRENYVCMNKLAYFFSRLIADNNLDDMKGILAVMLWLMNSSSGDLSEIHTSLVTRFRNHIHSDSYSCLQSKCPFKNICFLNAIKKKAQTAQLIIVNHALLFSDLYYGSNILPETKHLIIDEAHTIEDVATSCFSRVLNKKRIHDITVKLVEQKIWDFKNKPDEESLTKLKTLKITARALLELNGECFDYVESIFHEKEKENYFFKKSQKKLNMTQLTTKEKDELEELLSEKERVITETEKQMLELNDFMKQNLSKIQYAFYKKIYLEIQYIKDDLQYMKTNKENYVRWLEKEEFKKMKIFEIKVVPVDVGPSLQKYVFADKKSVVFTSATLSIKDNFNYFLSRIGYLENNIPIDTVSLSSPFDLERNVLLCVPHDSPEYEDTKAYIDSLSQYLLEVLIATGGRALVLFTSHKHLNDVYYLIKDKLAQNKIPAYCQGRKVADRNLIKMFKDNVNSVLMGTDTFWEGIDVPGESLSNVIIVKLPFEVPTDPIVMARMEKVALQGKSSFFEYVVPNAVVKFKQGVGRLIRSKTDKGSVIILDKRVLSSGYGVKFIQSVIAHKVFPKTLSEMKNILQEWF